VHGSGATTALDTTTARTVAAGIQQPQAMARRSLVPQVEQGEPSRGGVGEIRLAARGKQSEPQFVVCIDNRDYPASLELRKIYRVTPDPAATRHGQIHIVDESGEDYLYPQVCFLAIKLPQAAGQAILKAS
jgi:hypothetical protein